MTRIETERLLLRTPDASDVPGLFAAFSDPEVMRYIPSPPLTDPAEVRERVARRRDMDLRLGYTLWTVVEKASGTVLGNTGLAQVDRDGPDVEVAYLYARRYWGRGYATEAATAAVRYGLDALGLPRIVGLTYPENVASQRVLEKAGLRRVGTTRAYYGLELVLFEVLRAS